MPGFLGTGVVAAPLLLTAQSSASINHSYQTMYTQWFLLPKQTGLAYLSLSGCLSQFMLFLYFDAHLVRIP